MRRTANSIVIAVLGLAASAATLRVNTNRNESSPLAFAALGSNPPPRIAPAAASDPATVGYVNTATNTLGTALEALVATKTGTNELAAATNVLNASALSSGTVPLPRLAGITEEQLDSNAWFLATNGAPVFTNSAGLWVDANGNDATARRGVQELPFASVRTALTQAFAGDTVFINGVIDEKLMPIVVPDSVSLRGLSDAASIITGYTNSGHAALVPGNNSVIENLTIIGTNGFEFTIGKGGDDNGFTNVVFRNCTVFGDSDCFYFAGSAPSQLTIDACRLNSHWDNIAMYNSSVSVLALNSVLTVTAGQWTNQVTGANGLRQDLGQLTAQNCRVTVSGSLVGNHAAKSGNGGSPGLSDWLRLVNCVLEVSGTNANDILNNWLYDDLDLETFYLTPISVANTIRSDGRPLNLGLGRYAIPNRVSFVGGVPPAGADLVTLLSISNSTVWADLSEELYINDGFLAGASVWGGVVTGSVNGGGSFAQGAPPGFADSGWLRLSNSAEAASSGYIRYAAADTANIAWQDNVLASSEIVITGPDFTNSQYLVGLVSTAAAPLASDSIGWFSDCSVSPYWIAACGNGNSYSYKTSQVACAGSTRYTLGFRGDTNAIHFYTNGIFCFSIDANLPVGKPLELIVRTRRGEVPGSTANNSLWVNSIKAKLR